MKKIVILGPESTGKSTLCQQLAQHYNTLWCPEYARQYLLENGTHYTYDDLLTIAKGQVALEDAYVEKVSGQWSMRKGQWSMVNSQWSMGEDRNGEAESERQKVKDTYEDIQQPSTSSGQLPTINDQLSSNQLPTTNHQHSPNQPLSSVNRQPSSALLFLDTDMYVMKVWCEFVFGKCHDYINQQIAARKYDLYLLCNIDLPWVKDDLREYPDLRSRVELYNIYKQIMVSQSVPWASIHGNYEQRFQLAIQAIDQLMLHG